MTSIVLKDLARFGPEHCEALPREQAVAYTHAMVAGNYENFSVTSRLLPKRLRDDFANVYAFCRWADDLGDEVGDPAESVRLLDWWRDELEACYAGQPRHPVYVALAGTIEKHEIPREPFDDLIDAFVQDQSVDRYATWEQVLDYCTRSADPVGRIVLYLSGYRDQRRQQLSDRTCTALQLINFWQDVRRDILERDRIYFPADVLASHALTHQDLIDHVKGETPLDDAGMERYRAAIREVVDRTWPLFAEGRKLWPLVSRDVRNPIKLFTLGGEAIMKKVAAIDYDTLNQRPKLGKAGKAWLMVRAVAGRAGLG